MVENFGRKVTLILSLLTLAILSLVFLRPQLGLDLAGGTRLVYKIDFQKALDEGLITSAEFADKEKLVSDFIGIIRERIDPKGVLEPQIFPEGQDRVVIELPGGGGDSAVSASADLGAELLVSVRSITLSSEGDYRSFPVGGGVVQIDEESINYESREDNVLRTCTRSYGGTDEASHAAGATVRLQSTDRVLDLIENIGDLQFMIVAQPAEFAAAGVDETGQRKLVTDWMALNPQANDLSAFNRLSPANGGPHAAFKWYTHSVDDTEATPLSARTPVPVIVQKDDGNRFDGSNLGPVQRSQDKYGFPAVGFQMNSRASKRFGDFTEAYVQRSMAIVLSSEIVTSPNINDRLDGPSIIEGGAGGFSNEEVDDLVRVLRSGSLKIKPELEHKEQVSATLGQGYVNKGMFSFALGLVLVLSFVIFYYRRLGQIAALSLLANLVLLMGAMSFMQATLTLPGMAGIILTVGMAVDANILIYERIREEALRGRKPAQAAKDGFANALSTIVDANLTTLITAIVLLKFGTGPVRGFGTTLTVGILTSMFSALVITKVLVHRQLEKGIDGFSMSRWVQETSYPFMEKARKFIPVSLVLMALGVGVFTYQDDNTKLGIDFTGGMAMMVRTQQPQTVDAITDAIQTIHGSIGDSSQVKAVTSSKDSETGGYTEFRISFKPESDDLVTSDGTTKSAPEEIKRALADLLQKGPREGIALAANAAGRQDLTGNLYFAETHLITDIEGTLNALEGFEGATGAVTKIEGPKAAYSFSCTVGLDKDLQAVEDLISRGFLDDEIAVGDTFAWADPVPEQSAVGAAVVADLKDKAIFAILLSLFAVVMYIRVRFAEYSYGFAAVAAVVHDVTITLGALAAVNASGLVQAEITLPMIAAFLTIIGYSLNDTIVVFDRIRENMPRMKGDLKDVIDTSINQTLARTLLTSVTTLVVILILFAFNVGSRNVLEGFTFALAIGVLVGTYSSMFIACPVLHFLEKKRLTRVEAEKLAEAQPQAG